MRAHACIDCITRLGGDDGAQVLGDPLCARLPPSIRYRTAFIKALIAAAEAANEVCSLHCAVPHDASVA